jgi:hypothetical protein
MTAKSVMAAAATLALTLWATAASAQELVLGANLGGGSGIEGGDPGSGEMRFRRARSRIVGQLEMRIDDDKKNGLGVVVFAEVEPAASIGGSVRYLRWLSPGTYLFAGLTGVGAPHTLFGGELGAHFNVPMGDAIGLFVEPSFAALPLGTDLPQDHVLVWGLLTLGIHANL